VDDAGLLGHLQQLRALGGVHRQRLLADDVLAGLDRLAGERRVQVVGGGDVDAVDRPGGKRVGQRGEGRDAHRLGTGDAALRPGADQPDDLDAVAAQRVGVHRPDVPRPHHDRPRPIRHVPLLRDSRPGIVAGAVAVSTRRHAETAVDTRADGAAGPCARLYVHL